MSKVDIYSRFTDRKVTENVHTVSAIIPNYNYADFITERIDSIIHQTYPVSELIVLDDCSTDNSVDVIRKKLDQITGIQTKLIVNEKNSGSVFSQWQKGIREAHGEYFWICEADDSADPAFLETVMKGFDDPEVVLSYTDSSRIDDHNNVIRKNCQDLYNMFGSDHWDHPFITDGKEEVIHYLSVLNTILNVSGVVWKNNPDIVNIIEEAKSFKVAGDWYIYVKLLENGKLAFSNECLNYYRKHEGSVTSSIKADVEYGEICRIQEMVADQYHVGMDIYRWQRLRRSYMDQNVSPAAHKKRIAWVIPYPGKGSGGHRTIIQNVNALIRHGYECDIFVEDDGHSTPEIVANLIDEYYEPCAAKVYVGFEHSEDYDLLFATGWQTLNFVKAMKCKKRGYFIQDYEPWFFPMGNEYLLIENSYRQGYKQISIGKWLAHKMETEFNTPTWHFDFGADLNVYHPLKNISRENAICYVWQPEKPRRGSELAFQTLRIVKKLRPDIKIYLYGSDVKEEVPFEAEELGIISTTECNELYNKCRIGLCMSASNPSRIPFEMMAAGLPVVELYRENNLYDLPDGGVSLAESSPESVAQDILTLIDDEDTLAKMRAFGPEYMKDYPLEKGFEQFDSAVDDILAGKDCSDEKCVRSYNKPVFHATDQFRKQAQEILMPQLPGKVIVERHNNFFINLAYRGLRKAKRDARTIYHKIKKD